MGGPPALNDFTLLRDGEVFCNAVADDLARTRRRITWSTWWWQSDFQLLRPWPDSATEAERRERTALGMFEELSEVERRVLLNRFWFDLPLCGQKLAMGAHPRFTSGYLVDEQERALASTKALSAD